MPNETIHLLKWSEDDIDLLHKILDKIDPRWTAD